MKSITTVDAVMLIADAMEQQERADLQAIIAALDALREQIVAMSMRPSLAARVAQHDAAIRAVLTDIDTIVRSR